MGIKFLCFIHAIRKIVVEKLKEKLQNPENIEIKGLFKLKVILHYTQFKKLTTFKNTYYLPGALSDKT